MRFMILVKASKDSEAGVLPDENMIAKMVTYHEELQKAGALVDASGLQSSSKGWRIKYSGGKRTFIDGPFTETKELVAGYTIIKAKSRQERSSGLSAFQTRATKTARSRCVNCSSWKTSVPARRSSVFARWESRQRSNRPRLKGRCSSATQRLHDLHFI